jgi:peptide/nickel transport system permease protein
MMAMLRYFGYYVRQSRGAQIGFLIVGVMLLLVVLAPILATYDPQQANPADFLQSPSDRHWFGTDASGLDIYSRVVYAPRIDMVIAVSGVLLAVLIGCPLGVFVGYYPNSLFSSMIMRAMDFIQSLPVFIMAMALVAALGQEISNVIYVLLLFNLPVFVRLMRGEALSLREIEYIEAARCVGNSNRRIVFRHLLPNSLAPALIQLSVSIGAGILLTAGLSFIGAGVRVPTPEWGLMIASGAQNMITGQWWIAFFPGVAMSVAVLGFALLGDSLRDILDPARRR